MIKKTGMYRIFIVEDDEIIAKTVKRHLESWDYETALALDFSNVLGEFLNFAPQLVLMDIKLPFYNGYHWCQEIRKISKVPVIFLSSASDNLNIVMAVNMGGDDFIPKPFDGGAHGKNTGNIKAQLRFFRAGHCDRAPGGNLKSVGGHSYISGGENGTYKK